MKFSNIEHWSSLKLLYLNEFFGGGDKYTDYVDFNETLFNVIN